MPKTHDMKAGACVDDCKRFYLPGVVLHQNCSKCNEILTWDGSDHYLGYPVVNKPFTLNFYCEECNTDTKIQVVLNVSLTEI